MDKMKVPKSEFSSDRDPKWKPLTDKVPPPSVTRANLKSRFITTETAGQPSEGRRA